MHKAVQSDAWMQPVIPGGTGVWLLLSAFLGGMITGHAAALEFSTYFGGSSHDYTEAMALDGAGNVYVGGATSSTNDFPLLNPLQAEYGGGDYDAFVAKFDSNGQLVFSTFFGGKGIDAIQDLALDPAGNIVFVGQTRSVDLPSTPDAFQFDYAGGGALGTGDGFIAKLSSDGRELRYCSYFGGSIDDAVNGLAFGPVGDLYICGSSNSDNLPLKNALQSTRGGRRSDGFIARFDATLSSLVFSTYLGGENSDEDLKIATDPLGYIYVSGQTLSTNFPVTAGAFQTEHLVAPEIGENWDAFVAKLEPDGSSLVYSTYVGGPSVDAALGIVVDAGGAAYLTGAISHSWPQGTFPLGFQSEPGYGYGSGDGWVAKLKPDGSNFEWFSYLGGEGDDVGYDISLGTNGDILVTGITTSFDFPVRDAVQTAYGGGSWDAFVAKVSADGHRLVFSTLLGGLDLDRSFSIAADGLGDLVCAGRTESTNFPTRLAFQSVHASAGNPISGGDVFVSRLTSEIVGPQVTLTRSDNRILLHWPADFTGYVLESCPGLELAGSSWVPVLAAPFELGGQLTVVQSLNQSNRLYRLRRP